MSHQLAREAEEWMEWLRVFATQITGDVKDGEARDDPLLKVADLIEGLATENRDQARALSEIGERVPSGDHFCGPHCICQLRRVLSNPEPPDTGSPE